MRRTAIVQKEALRDGKIVLSEEPLNLETPFEKLDGFMAISVPTPSKARTIERGFALGSEYFIKIGYAALIQKLLDASSDDEPRDISTRSLDSVLRASGQPSSISRSGASVAYAFSVRPCAVRVQTSS